MLNTLKMFSKVFDGLGPSLDGVIDTANALYEKWWAKDPTSMLTFENIVVELLEIWRTVIDVVDHGEAAEFVKRVMSEEKRSPPQIEASGLSADELFELWKNRNQATQDFL
jgi:hypothetical protein